MNNNTVTNDKNISLGDIEISQETLEIIAGIATNEVDGVEGMYGKFTAEVTELFGHKNHQKGINLSTTDYGRLAIDVYCYLQYGLNIPQVVKEIQHNIKSQVLHMTEIDLAEVNIHIVDIVPPKSETGKIFDFSTRRVTE